MKEEKKASPISVLLGWGKPYHGKFIGSVVLAVLGVACQMVPYFCVAHIVTMMLDGEQDFSLYVTACMVALCGYLGKVLFSSLSTTVSHTAAYYTLRDIRGRLTGKLARVPMGTILDTPSGQYKTTIVDRVEGMESTFAHLIPEMTANILVPVVIVVYLFHYGLAHGAVVPCYAGSRSCRNVCRYDELPKEMGGCGQSRKRYGECHCGIYRRD